jgi:anti-sigma factor RsiW
MKRLDSNEIMDYLDGTLDKARQAQIEAHLAENAEDRELVGTMRVAMQSLHELDAIEPVRAGDDFWMKVRDGLPSQAPRRSWMAQLGAMLAPQTRRTSLALRVAVLAGILALASQWFAPQQSIQTTYAGDGIPADAKAFIQMSSERHSAYVSSQPLSGASGGDTSSAETGDMDDEPGGSTP